MKNKFEIYTKKEFTFIPANIIIIKNKFGWTFMYSSGAQWYVNSTNDSKDCPPEENEAFLKKLVKGIKEQIKLI